MDVTKLDIYQKDSEMKPFLNVERAREDKLLNKWLVIKKAYLDETTKFDKAGNRDGTEEKLHLEFEDLNYKMTLNYTNWHNMIGLFGKESDDWIGERVKLRVENWPGANPGLVIKSRQELDDEGEDIPTSSSSSEPYSRDDVL